MPHDTVSRARPSHCDLALARALQNRFGCSCNQAQLKLAHAQLTVWDADALSMVDSCCASINFLAKDT